MEVRISTGEIFIVLTLGDLVRPMDFKPPITITNTRFMWAGKCLEDMRMVGWVHHSREGGPMSPLCIN